MSPEYYRLPPPYCVIPLTFSLPYQPLSLTPVINPFLPPSLTMGDYVEADHREESSPSVTASTTNPTVRSATSKRVWSDFMRDSYQSRKPPVATGTVDVKKIEDAAREKLKDRQGMSPASVSVSSTSHPCCLDGWFWLHW